MSKALANLVSVIDAIRVSNHTDDDKAAMIRDCESVIKCLKKLTGNQTIAGSMHLGR